MVGVGVGAGVGVGQGWVVEVGVAWGGLGGGIPVCATLGPYASFRGKLSPRSNHCPGVS